MLKIDLLQLGGLFQQGVVIAVLDGLAVSVLILELLVGVVVGLAGVAAQIVIEAGVGIGTGSAAAPVVGGQIPLVVAGLLEVGGGHAGVGNDLKIHMALEDRLPLLLQILGAGLPLGVGLVDGVQDGDVSGLGINVDLFTGLHEVIPSHVGIVAVGAPGIDHIFDLVAGIGIAVAEAVGAQQTGLLVDIPAGRLGVAEDVLGQGLTIQRVINGLTIGIGAADGVVGVLAVDVDVVDGQRAVADHTRIVDVHVDGLGIGAQVIQLALFPQLDAGVHLGHDADVDLIPVEQIGQPVIGVLGVDLDVVIVPGGEQVGTAAHPVIQVGAVRGGGAVGAQALLVNRLINGGLFTAVEVVADILLAVFAIGDDLDGVVVDLLDADVFPGGAFALHVGLGIDDGDGVVGNVTAHAVGQLGIQRGLEGIDPGIGVDGVAVVPVRILTQGDIPGVLIDLDGQLGRCIGDVVEVQAALIGIRPIKEAHTINSGGLRGAVHVVLEVQVGVVRSQVGVINLLGGGIGGRRIVAGRRVVVAGIVGVGVVVIAAGSQHGQNHHGGEKQRDQFLTHVSISFFPF